MDNSTTDSPKPDFYVGYLPTPPSHRRFLKLLLPMFLIAMLAASVLVARAQRDPGASQIVSAEVASWTGTLYMEPYPMLITDDRTIYLVMGMGKFGVADRVAEFDGVRCIVEGWALARSDRHGIQLAPESNAIRRDSSGLGSVESKPVLSSSKLVRLTGEIVDGKCYLGAMKPADGKGHKACAILCIDGGLPPLFASIDPNQFDQLPLVLIDGNAQLPDEILKLAGETVILEGNLQSMGGLQILNTTIGQVQRWSPILANPVSP